MTTPAAHPVPEATGRRRAIGVLVLVATLLELALIVMPSEAIDLVGHRGENAPVTVMGEEYHRGSIAQEVLDGPLLPLTDYQFAPWLGGSLVAGLMAVPFFAVLGPNVLALKLVALVFNALTTAFAFLLLDRRIGRRAAWIAGLLVACAPPTYSLLAMLNLGNHCESNALALAILLVFLRVHDDGRVRPGVAGGLGFGLLVGFSIWFVYSLAILPGVLLGFALARDRRLVARPAFWATLCGVAIGFAPWFAANAGRSDAGTGLYGRSLGDVLGSGLAGLPARLVEIVARDLPASVGLDALAAGAAPALELVYWVPLALLAVAAGVLGAPRRAGSADAPPFDVARIAGTYLVVMTVGLAASGYSLGPDVLEYRYLAPLWPFVWILAAIALERIARRPGGVAPALGVAGGLCALAVAGVLALVDPSRFGAETGRRGTSEMMLARFFALTKIDDTADLAALARRIDERRDDEVRDRLYYSMGRTLKDMVLVARRPRVEGEPAPYRDEAAVLAALAALREAAPTGLRAYFEPPVEGERVWPWSRRDAFWRDWRERNGLPPGDGPPE